jgi:hypothetical protein
VPQYEEKKATNSRGWVGKAKRLLQVVNKRGFTDNEENNARKKYNLKKKR